MQAVLDGKVALVTGAGSGIGRASCLALAAAGARVVCTDRDGDAATATAQLVEAAGGVGRALACDVTRAEDTERAAAAAVSAYGRLDIAFANAGVPGAGRAGEVSEEAWASALAVNLTGTWLTIRAALPHMVATGSGSLIATSSIGGVVGVRNLAPYSAAKAGVIGLMRQVAVDYGRDGIRANVIAPGTIRTPLTEDTFRAAGLFEGRSDAEVDAMMARAGKPYPLGRLGAVEEVTGAVVYLASDASSWTTGTVMVVDGGLTAS